MTKSRKCQAANCSEQAVRPVHVKLAQRVMGRLVYRFRRRWYCQQHAVAADRSRGV